MSFLENLTSAVGLLKGFMEQGKDPQAPEVKNAATQLVDLIQNATGKSLTRQEDLQNLVDQYGSVLSLYLGDALPDEAFIAYVSKAAGLST